MEKYEWKVDTSICGLLKTMKSEYLNDTLNKGRLYFNYPSFYAKTELMSAQYDKYDSWEDIDAYSIIYAPIVEDDGKNIKYGQARKLSDHAVIHHITERNKHRPICCFRTIKRDDFHIENNAYYFSLGKTADKIMEEFGHDAFVYFIDPYELQRRMNEQKLFFGHEVYYGINNWDYTEFVRKTNLECCSMFQKDERYSWQKEYRIVLSPHEGEKGFPVDVGAITDIAIGGKLENLRNGGLVFAEHDNPIFAGLRKD